MKIHLRNARISFANGLWQARAMEQTQKPKFGADFILMPDTEVVAISPGGSQVKTTMDKVMLEVANEAWPGRGETMLSSFEASKKCYRDGNKRLNNATGEVYEGYHGFWYVTAKNATQPRVFDRYKDPATGKARRLSESDGKPYSGCRVNVSLDIYAMTKGTKAGVFSSLLGVQFWADDEAFSGGGVVSDDEFAAEETQDFAPDF